MTLRSQQFAHLLFRWKGRPRSASGLMVVVVLSAGLALAAPSVAQPSSRGVALPPSDLLIMPFDNASGDSELDWLQGALMRVLARDLLTNTELSVVDPRRIEVEMSRAGLKRGGVNDKDVVALARTLAASQAIVGAYSAPDEKGHVALNLRMLSVNTGRTLAGAQVRADLASPIVAARRLLVDILKRARFEGVTEELLARSPAPPRAMLEAIHRALMLKLADPSVARENFITATRLSPIAARQFVELGASFPAVQPSVWVLPVVPRGSAPSWWGPAAQVVLTKDLGLLGLAAPREKGLPPSPQRWTVKAASVAARKLGVDVVVLSTIAVEDRTVKIEANLIAAHSELIEATVVGAGEDLAAALLSLEQALATIAVLDFAGFRPTLMISSETAASLESKFKDAKPGSLVSAKNIYLAQPRITRFAAAAGGPGQGAGVLSWNAADVERCEIEGMGEVPLRGRRMVSPASTTEYRLTCIGQGKTVEATTSVTVAGAIAWHPILFWSILGVTAASATLAVGAFGFATFPAAAANQLHGMQLLVSDPGDRDALRLQRDQLALIANISMAVGAVGAAAAAAGMVGLVVIEIAE